MVTLLAYVDLGTEVNPLFGSNIGTRMQIQSGFCRGRVKWFSNARRYCFLVREGEPDVFCHSSSIKNDGYRTLVTGTFVSFEIAEGDRGLEAKNVHEDY